MVLVKLNAVAVTLDYPAHHAQIQLLFVQSPYYRLQLKYQTDLTKKAPFRGLFINCSATLAAITQKAKQHHKEVNEV